MVATVSPADDQYHHTVNTLKYADRAKEIKTHIHKNIGTVDTHVEDYQRMIENLQVEVGQLRKELAQKESQLSVKPAGKAADDELSWLNILSRETSENVQERINLQKALFELEETNLHNRIELQHLDDSIAKHQIDEKDRTIIQALRARRQLILDNIRDNDEAGASYKKDIAANEKCRCQLQDMIEEAISNNGNKTYLHILSQYRLLGMANTELQFEMAMRDHVIHNQREAMRNLWSMLSGLGLKQKQIMDLAAKQGITIEDWTVPNALPTPMACVFQHHQDVSTTAYFNGHCDVPTVCREEHQSSYYLLSHDHPHSMSVENEKNWACAKPGTNCNPGKPNLENCRSYSTDMMQLCPQREVSFTSASCNDDLGRRTKDSWFGSSQKQQEVSAVEMGSCQSFGESASRSSTSQSLFGGPSNNFIASGIPNSHSCYYNSPLAFQDSSKLQSPYMTVVPRTSNLPGS